MTEIPRLSVKEALVLKLLQRQGGEMYGLEMVTASNSQLKRGTVYVTLGRMEDKGFITSRKEPGKENVRGSARRLYRIAGLGERVLAVREAAEGAWWGATA